MNINLITLFITMTCVLIFSIFCYSQESPVIKQAPAPNNSISEEMRIRMLTSRISEINDKISNPSLPHSEREMLKKEKEFLTEILMRHLTTSTQPK